MKHYVVNSVRVGTRPLFAGTSIDDAQVDIAPLMDAGAQLWPADDRIVAFAAARVEELRNQRGDSSETIDRIMLAAVAESQRLGVGNYVDDIAELQGWGQGAPVILANAGLEAYDVMVISTRRRYRCSSLSTVPVDGVDSVPTFFADGGASAGRWLTDATTLDPAGLRYSYFDTIAPVPLATVNSTGQRYRFDATATTADDGDAVIAARSSATTFSNGNPTDLSTNPGRWLKVWP